MEFYITLIVLGLVGIFSYIYYRRGLLHDKTCSEVYDYVYKYPITSNKFMDMLGLKYYSTYKSVNIFTNGKEYFSVVTVDGVPYEFMLDDVDTFIGDTVFLDLGSLHKCIDGHIKTFLRVSENPIPSHIELVPFYEMSEEAKEIIVSGKYDFPLQVIRATGAAGKVSKIVPWSYTYIENKFTYKVGGKDGK